MKEKNIITKILSNIYIKNILMMGAILAALIIILLVILNFYTKHNESITVPAVKGLQVGEAASILNSSDLKYEVIDSIFQTGGVPGAIIDQIPREKSNVKKGRTIFLVIQAKNVQMVAIPELKDFSQRQAEAQLHSLGFNNIIIHSVPSAYKGIVISIEYKGRTVTAGQKIPKGSTLQMIVGSGGETIQEDSLKETEANIEQRFFE